MTKHVGTKAMLITGLVLLAAQLHPTGQTPLEFLLSPGRAGRLEVGMPVDAVYRLIGRERHGWSTCTGRACSSRPSRFSYKVR